MGIAVACTVVELVDGIECWDTFSLQGGELGNFMSQSIAASLQKEAEEGVASTVDQLLLYLGTIDKCLIPKEEYSHLSHLGDVLEKCCRLGMEISSHTFFCEGSIYNSLNIGSVCLRHFRLMTPYSHMQKDRFRQHETIET